MWPTILMLLFVVVLTGGMLWRTKWKLDHPGYLEEEAARKIAKERKARDRRKNNTGNVPERRKGLRKKKKKK